MANGGKQNQMTDATDIAVQQGPRSAALRGESPSVARDGAGKPTTRPFPNRFQDCSNPRG
jgi:hypothetical protein